VRAEILKRAAPPADSFRVIDRGAVGRLGARRGVVAHRGGLDLQALLAREALVVVVWAFWVTALLILAPAFLSPDSWLALVAGREIAGSGLPHVDTLTVWAAGRQWVDQQWGAQLVLYEVTRVDGVSGLAWVSAGCVATALALVAVAARRLGGSAVSTALALSLPVAGTPWMAQVRAQCLALPLFVAAYWLLASSGARRSRSLWVLPVLVLWANVHGSVVLGAGLAVLTGLVRVVRDRGRERVYAGLLAAGAPLCVLASPYNLDLVGYYRSMLVHSPVERFVTEWQPPTPGAMTAVFYATALTLAAAWGAHRRGLTAFERWALPLLLLAALSAVRNMMWFELAAAIAAPRLIDAMWSRRSTQTAAKHRLNLALAVTALAAVAVAGVAAAARREAAYEKHWPSATAAAVISRAAGPHGMVLSDDRNADWLLWAAPSLAGRVAYDSRFELFDATELRQLQLLHLGSHPIWRECGAQARVVTFYGSSGAADARRERVLAHGSRMIVSSARLVAVAQPPSRAAACPLGPVREREHG
jgi:hypothetical protein